LIKESVQRHGQVSLPIRHGRLCRHGHERVILEGDSH
jgi:hypothetical protein